ncbi:hypothetical protein BDQ12DRAFT_673935 [Crucibulum laeve]|uniref:Uncharacterized protein n=1 Tax=Crucibulum laeve TaxID=68775 RepID=A0A5C3MHY6_9AGAR|nr:hypothetical protein BDQ12DRAFT_673935 [Crucibulum laeve]
MQPSIGSFILPAVVKEPLESPRSTTDIGAYSTLITQLVPFIFDHLFDHPCR